jgi:uncharacterized peroxidase-related enzyme
MRLGILRSGHRRTQRVALRIMRIVGRTEPDPVVVTSLYRPELFGRAFMRAIETVMRGPSDWTAGERDLMAAFVSRLNNCPFCAGIHGGMAERNRAGDLLHQLDRWDSGELPAKLTTTMRLFEKVTLHPDVVGPADVAPMRAAGVSDDAIRDALYVGTLFNTINRVANAVDFGWETEADRLKLVAGLHRVNYHVPAFLLR